MNCPVCEHSRLTRSPHGGFLLFQCGECHGHLIETTRLRSLQRRVNKDVAEIVNSVAEDSRPSTPGEIWCPRCRGRMRKHFAGTEPDFEIDTCPHCDFNWLDGGELARVEIDFEFHVQQIELKRMRERLASMTPAEKREYEENIARLSASGEPFTDGVKTGLLDLASYIVCRSLL